MMANYKNAASASASFGVIRKKLLANNAATPPSNSKKATNAAEISAGGADDDEGGCKFTPINTPKKNKRVAKSQKRIDPMVEAEEDGEVVPATVSYIKSEDDEGEEAKLVLAAPSKKRVRNVKDDTETSAKRARVALDVTTAASSIIPDSEGVPPATTISPTKDDESNGLVQGETPVEESQNGQGD